MAKLKLAHAETIVEAAISEARKMSLAPMAVEAGGHVMAFKCEDGTGSVRFDIAYGTACGAPGMGFGARSKVPGLIKAVGIVAAPGMIL